MAPVESLYSERSSMHIVIVNYNVFVSATHTETVDNTLNALMVDNRDITETETETDVHVHVPITKHAGIHARHAEQARG